MLQIEVSGQIKAVCPNFAGVAVLANVKNSLFSQPLWDEINLLCERLKKELELKDIRHLPTIDATREVYKKLGKDPNRYRPSAEALRRRIIQGKELYQIDTLVDLINYVSIETGYSIGGFDADQIKGNRLILGVGEAGEPFTAIGRGSLNIEGLPVYRDELGGIGTPTSDEERTKMTPETKQILALVNGYSGKSGLKEAGEVIQNLLVKYASSDGGVLITYN